VKSDLIITLIGMPGSGKSTVGRVLSKQLGLERVDTDRLIEAQEKQTLQEIVDHRGNAIFRAIEEAVLTEMPLFPSIISTGGSAVYSDKIMGRLRAASVVVYLRARFDTIEYRVSLDPQRGIAADGAQSLSDIYDERIPLYERYSEFAVDCDDTSPEAVAEIILGCLQQS
jgi:shikimate kinase